ncbi:MAG: hypothetical protein K6G36_02815 [Candidatus Saccharibacteria bacterium]|nr:hypothetical protein [Candidatus Saccharibacteria bacterium]
MSEERNMKVGVAVDLLSKFDFGNENYDYMVEFFYQYYAGGAYVSRVSSFEEKLHLWDADQWRRFASTSGFNLFSMRIVIYPKSKGLLPAGLEATKLVLGEPHFDRLIYKDKEKHSYQTWLFPCQTSKLCSAEAVFSYIGTIEDGQSERVRTDLALALA